MALRFAFILILALPGMAADPSGGTFKSEVLPILEHRCMPCHFKGGKVYEKLPFDGPAVPGRLGERLFTRIKDPKEQEAIRRFLSEWKVESGSRPISKP